MPVKCGDIFYIGGPITGLPNGNKIMFTTAEIFLKRRGAVVLNPSFLPEGLKDHTAYMNICLPMLRECNKVLLLLGWQQSKGAMLEHAEAMRIGMPVFEFLPTSPGETPNHQIVRI